MTRVRLLVWFRTALGPLLGAGVVCAVAAGRGGSAIADQAHRREPSASVSALVVRGITIGPIENALHPDRGYGSEACAKAMAEARRFGATWVSLTPFGRIWDLEPTGIDRSFEAPFADNRSAVRRAIRQAHEAGLKVMLVPHLWAETGGWRGELDVEHANWAKFERAYAEFVVGWARVAALEGAELFSIGVELRSWVTSSRAPSFERLIQRVKGVYPGLVTYAANWDDADDTVIWGALDVIGINAFYPLAGRPGAGFDELLAGARRKRDELRQLAMRWGKPVLFTEVGYTARVDTALRPWEWPEDLSRVVESDADQASAYLALLAPLLGERWFTGFFIWRFFADPYDVSQEPNWGFSPKGREAELIVRDAFGVPWARDGAQRSDLPPATARRVGAR